MKKRSYEKEMNSTLVSKIELHPTSCQYPLIIYLTLLASRFVNDGAAAVAVLDLDTSRANKLIEAVGAMTTTKSAASETKSKVKLCFSFVVSGAFFNYVDQIFRKLTQFSKFNNFLWVC